MAEIPKFDALADDIKQRVRLQAVIEMGKENPSSEPLTGRVTGSSYSNDALHEKMEMLASDPFRLNDLDLVPLESLKAQVREMYKVSRSQR